MSDISCDIVVDLRHEAGMMPDWRDSSNDERLVDRLGTYWPNMLAKAAAEIAALRADLAIAREREGATGLEYRGG